MGENGLEYLSDKLMKMTNIESLFLNYCNINDIGFIYLCNTISDLINLKDLRLCCIFLIIYKYR